jgi:oxygen-independent coproporphyrinogen-3 oxidase
MTTDPPRPATGSGVYVHLPFCSVKCSYCDFPVAAGQDHRIDRYLDALLREIAEHAPDLGGDVETIYLGGGTPSRLSVAAIERVLRAVRGRYGTSGRCEVSIEANPEDLDAERARSLSGVGVDRITVGVQSLDDGVLRRTGRQHDAARALRAVRDVRGAAIGSIGVDLIAGLPGERLQAWGETVDRVIEAGCDHVSVYLLETDHPSALGKAIAAGRTSGPDDDALADAYQRSVERLARAGLEQYEISNFARPGHESRHNGKYWDDSWYAGLGLGAHAYVEGARRANVRGLTRYLRTVEEGESPVGDEDPWDPARRCEEALFLGLRRSRGVDLASLGRRYGVDLDRAYDEVWRRHVRDGLLVREGDVARLTPDGRLRSNTVFRDLIGVLGPAATPAGAGGTS